MAWIETYNGAVNLDTVQYLHVVHINNVEVKIVAESMTDKTDIFTADPKYRDRLIKVTHQIAQIARGNAYISQEEIRRMMDVAQDN